MSLFGSRAVFSKKLINVCYHQQQTLAGQSGPHVGTVDVEIVGTVLVRAVLRLIQKAAHSNKNRSDPDPDAQPRIHADGDPPGARADDAERNHIGKDRVDHLQTFWEGQRLLYQTFVDASGKSALGRFC
jgi:hypothetical protein